MGAWLREKYNDEQDRFGHTHGHWSFGETCAPCSDVNDLPRDAVAVTLDRSSRNWDALREMPCLEEIVCTAPTRKQRDVLWHCKGLKRLTVTGCRRADLQPVTELRHLEELALRNVSGPKSLSFLQNLPKLRSLLIENMQSLSDWSALSACTSLKCLAMSSGLVEKKPVVESFAFLSTLASLEHLHVGLLTCRGSYPVLDGLQHCRQLKSYHINPFALGVADHAFAHAALPERAMAQHKWVLFVASGAGAGDDPKQRATTAKEIERIEGDVLEFDPRVKREKDKPFTHFGRGDRDLVMERARAFEAHFAAERRRALDWIARNE